MTVVLGAAPSDLITVAELAEYTQLPLLDTDQSALFLIKVASNMVRDYLHQDLYFVASDIAYCDPLNGQVVLLEQLPVVRVVQVEYTADSGVTWVVAPAGSYTVSRRTGVVAAKPFSGTPWPSDPESWRITYDHGFNPIPDTIKGVVCEVAGRIYASPIGVDLERIGQRQVKYAVETEGLSPLMQVALDHYKVARVG